MMSCHSRYVNVGLFYLRQLFFAKFDLKVHVDKGWMHVLLLSWTAGLHAIEQRRQIIPNSGMTCENQSHS
jgi:hypothetical protein